MKISLVANLALAVRVMIVGGFLLILPHITRKGLLFGTYVGEAPSEVAAGSRLLGRWHIGCVMVMAAPLLVGYGISFAGRPVAGSFIGTAILLGGALALYLRFHFQARKLAPAVAAEAAMRASASLGRPERQAVGLARLALGLCIVIALGTFAYVTIRLPDMNVESVAAVLFVPSANIVVSPFMALYALLAAGAKRSIRGGSGGRSIEAQNAFRATVTRLFSGSAVLICAFFALLSVQILRIGLSQAQSLGAAVWVVGGIVSAWLLGMLIWLVTRYGQAGALRERGTLEAPLTNGIASDARWVWGLFYIDREDASIMIEKRFGLGYTLNYGNPIAILIAVIFGVALLGLVGLTVFAVLTGRG
jgi:uncharacterized membrane protein